MSVNVDFTEHLMDYEIEIIKRLAQKEGLLVLASGLSTQKILLSFLKPYCDSTELILVLNGTQNEVNRIALEMCCSGVVNVPKYISDLTQKKRNQLYNKGGVYFASSQVLILDFLKNVVDRPVHGIIVLNAEKASKNFDESFIISLAQSKGLNFTIGISDQPSKISKALPQVCQIN